MSFQDIIHIPGLLENILSYSETPKYKLLDWIDEKKLDWSFLSKNPAAIDLLKDNQDKINWSVLSSNPAIFEIDHKETYKHISKIANNIRNKL